MKVRYRAHPPAYALGETEKFYGEMEARGWRLQKRGGTFSKFVPVEPSAARYRVEVLAPSLLDVPEMSEEQLAVYEDCGWTYVTDSGCLYIFRAPAGSDAPEFYMDPRQQAATLKALRRRDWWAMLLALLLLGVNFLMAFSLGRGGAGEHGGASADRCGRYSHVPAVCHDPGGDADCRRGGELALRPAVPPHEAGDTQL